MKAILILGALLVLQSVTALPTPPKSGDSTEVGQKNEDTSDNGDDDIMKKIAETMGMVSMFGQGVNGTSGSVTNIVKATVGTAVVAIDGNVHFEITDFKP